RKTSGVAAGPRQARNESAADWVDGCHKHDWNGAARLLQRPDDRAGRGDDHIRRERDKFRRVSAKAVEIPRPPAIVDPYVVAADPAAFLQSLCERGDARRSFRIVRSHAHEHPNASHPPGLLRVRRERPRYSRAAEQRDELAPFHLTEMHPNPLTGREHITGYRIEADQ